MKQNVVKIIETLKEVGYVREEMKEELSSLSVRELIVDFIFPKVIYEGGQDTRGWRLSSCFMRLMTVHAQDFIEADVELGNVMFELALQRLQRHPELPAINYDAMLPVEYRKYSARYDQAGLWGPEEWEFMRERLLDGLELSEEKYRRHTQHLILDILERTSPVEAGYFCGWFSARVESSEKDLWEWTVDAVLRFSDVDEVVNFLLAGDANWRRYKAFFAKFAKKMDWANLFAHIDLNKECYYTGVLRLFMKMTGRYNKATERKIKEEILKG